MKASEKNLQLQDTIARVHGVLIPLEDANTLRRAALTIHRWDLQLTNGDIQQDENTGKCYRLIRIHAPHYREYREAAVNRHAPALQRARDVAKRNGLTLYYQGDCTGWPLHVGVTVLDHNSYSTQGVGVRPH